MNNFEYKGKRLFCENTSVEEICKKIKTPFYLYSSNQILENFNLLAKKFKGCNNALDYYTKKNIENNLTFKTNKKKAILNKFFFSQPKEVILRSLNIVIQKIGQKYYPPRGKSTIFLINQLKQSKKFEKMTLGGCLFKKINETIIISKESG